MPLFLPRSGIGWRRRLWSLVKVALPLLALAGVFMARYRLELVLATPFVALAMAYYLHLGYKPDSGAQYPEHLYRKKKLMMLVALAFGSCVALLFVNLPWLYDLVSPTHFRR